MNTHLWPIETESRVCLYMDHTPVKVIGLILILVESFSERTEGVTVQHRKIPR